MKDSIDKHLKKLEGKLRLPIHISYISKYLLKLPEDETREILNKGIEMGRIAESGYANDFFELKSSKK